MTTTETNTMDLAQAVLAAGVDGRIARSGDVYTVSQDNDGDWQLTRSQSSFAEPLSTYVTDGWNVLSAAGEESQEELADWEKELLEQSKAAPVEEPKAVITTVAEFFRGIQEWTLVSDSYATYVFTGWGTDSSGHQVATMIHGRYMTETEWTESNLDNDVRDFNLEVVMVDDIPQMADRMVRFAIRHMIGNKQEAEALALTLGETQAKLAEALADFRAVNEHINAYANEMQMCPDYERRIYGWNDGGVNGQEPLHNKLLGRVKNHYVYVTNSALYPSGDMHVYVEARSPEEAKEKVVAMSGAQILTLLQEQRNFAIDGLEFTVGQAGI